MSTDDHDDGPEDEGSDGGKRIRIASWKRVQHLLAIGQLDRARTLAAEQVSKNPDDIKIARSDGRRAACDERLERNA